MVNTDYWNTAYLQIFCVHGGIPTPEVDGGFVDSISRVPVPLKNPEDESQLAWDIMWSDPVR